jgi:hypothetical protein
MIFPHAAAALAVPFQAMLAGRIPGWTFANANFPGLCFRQ